MRIWSKKFTSSTCYLFSLVTRYSLLMSPEPVGRRRRHDRLRAHVRSDLVQDAQRLAGTAGQVDTEVLASPVVVVGVAQLHLGAVGGQHLDVQAERLHLLDQHLEGLGDAGLGDVLALDDG